MSVVLEELLLERAALEEWKRVLPLIAPEARTQDFQDCFVAAFASGAGWMCDALEQGVVRLRKSEGT